MKDKFNIESLRPFIDMDGFKGDETVERKRFSSKITISPEEEKTCVAVISTNDEDAVNDVLIPTGADLRRFTKNPVVMYAHNYSGKPVAKAVALSVNEDGITAKLKFADTEEANDVWSLIKGGFLNANSIGFIIKEAYRKGTEDFNKYIKENKMKVKDTVERIISKFELLENSIVPIPWNSEALIQAVSTKSITLSDKILKELDLPTMPTNTPVNTPASMPASVIPDSTKEVKEVIVDEELIDKDEEDEDRINAIPDVVEKMVEEKEEKEAIVEKIEEPKPEPRYIKVIRSGGVDIKKLAELKVLSRKGKIV